MIPARRFDQMNKTHAPSDPVQQARRENLKTLVNQHGSRAVAERLGLKNTSYLSHLTVGHRPITEKGARNIEEAFGLPSGWLSSPRGVQPPAPVAVDLLAQVITAVRQLDSILPPHKEAEIVTLVYARAVESGKIDAGYVQQLVRLAGK
jgi:hypothetical protein